MGKKTHRSRGFTLIASLLLLLLLSAIAAGLMYTVSGSGHVGNNDLESNSAYYGAESGMEKLTSDLLSLYQQKLAPTQADLTALAKTSPPSSAQVPGMTYLETVQWTNVDLKGNPLPPVTSVVSQGPYQGLTAEIIPMSLQVTAMRPYGATVSMTRGVEIALVPVFQFGVFSDSDLTFFAGPEFSFLGRTHTNGNLFLTSNQPGPLVLGDKVTAAGQILRDRLPNNYPVSSGNYDNSVYIPNSTGGCDAYAIAKAVGKNPGTCPDFGTDSNNATNDASWYGGIPASATPGQANVKYATNSASFNGFIATGVAPLQLPFVQGANIGSADSQIEIIRKQETLGESPTSPVGSSREFNKADIRILLGDTESELHPNGSANDANDVQLEAQVSEPLASGGTGFFAIADPVATGDPNLIKPRCAPNGNKYVNNAAPYPTAAASENGCGAYANATWPLVRGWLRVEYCNSSDCNTAANWVGVTTEWLKYGFARDIAPPVKPVTAGGAGTNDVHPDAILIFQELAKRDGAASAVTNGNVTVTYNYKGNKVNQVAIESRTANGGNGNNFYPINFFDEREGYPRDPKTSPLNGVGTGYQCYANGIMNTVELDVGNLAQWLAGNGPYAGGSGTKVNDGPQNGYLVYFSDRRGEMLNPNAVPAPNVTNGESGIEDVINASDPTNGVPDGKLDPITAGYNGNNGFSPEDVDQDKALDNWGEVNIGDGFGLNTNTNPANPFVAVDCMNGGRQNWVSGARHALRLVDGTLGNLPTPGFTVAAENPLYIQGDYNSNAGDTVWNNPPVDQAHSAAGVIADAVTLLSNSWTDLNDMQNTNTMSNRNSSTTSYRVAIAAGKNMDFPYVATYPSVDFGTDGGVHNFLRYVEDWSGTTLNYRGSMVSLYYSEYATGTFKCCQQVYNPPTRNYSFDKDFLSPTSLPPGTPMLQDIDTLSYWQNFTPCTTQSGGNCTN